MVATELPHHCPALPEVIEELKSTTSISLPVAAMSMVGYLKNMTLVMCMGKIGSLELAGGALAIGFTNITGYSFLSGLAMGMDPLCSQAIGSKNMSLAYLTLQKTIIMLLLASIPVAFLWLKLEYVMLLLRQDPDITRIASLYCFYSVPDLIANSFLHPLRIYLRCQGHTWALMWCTMISTALHIPITILLTFNLNLGATGIAISTFVTNFNTVFLLLCYIHFTGYTSNHDQNQNDYYISLLTQLRSSKTTSTPLPVMDWWVLLRLAIPSCVAVCLEWWWYEFMTIFAGYLDKPKVALAASAVVIQTTSLMYTLPNALSTSASTRVGQELGAGRPWKARLATIVTIGLALLSSIFGLLWTTFGREIWGRVFTDDNEVLDLIRIVLPIIGLCELANCPQTTSCGILRGSARPGIGAGINFYSFYLVGAPVALFLGFRLKLGFVGLCYGLLAAQIVCCFSVLFVVYRTDWQREALKAKDLVSNCKTIDVVDECQILV